MLQMSYWPNFTQNFLLNKIRSITFLQRVWFQFYIDFQKRAIPSNEDVFFHARLDAVGQRDARIATPDLRFLNLFFCRWSPGYCMTTCKKNKLKNAAQGTPRSATAKGTFSKSRGRRQPSGCSYCSYPYVGLPVLHFLNSFLFAGGQARPPQTPYRRNKFKKCNTASPGQRLSVVHFDRPRAPSSTLHKFTPLLPVSYMLLWKWLHQQVHMAVN